jgi:hypothetical protein
VSWGGVGGVVGRGSGVGRCWEKGKINRRGSRRTGGVKQRRRKTASRGLGVSWGGVGGAVGRGKGGVGDGKTARATAEGRRGPGR